MDLAELAAAMTRSRKCRARCLAALKFMGRLHRSRGNRSFTCAILFSDMSRVFPADLEARTALGTVELKATALSRRSDPVNLEGSFPLKLEKRESGYAFNNDGPVSATLNFPAIFLARLPRLPFPPNVCRWDPERPANYFRFVAPPATARHRAPDQRQTPGWSVIFHSAHFRRSNRHDRFCACSAAERS